VLDGGKLNRADWRRQNVNNLIERIHTAIHVEKPWMRFGVSPFGLGRADRRPPGITGFSQYDKLYADVELWLANGWMDYLAPQLYWPIDQAPQAFGTLLDYWIGQNTTGLQIWPGMFTSRIDNSAKSWTPEEIVNQVALMRSRDAIAGHIHFSMITLMENRQGIADQLKRAYASDALVPPMPRLEGPPPPAPVFTVGNMQRDGKIALDIFSQRADSTRQFAVWKRYGTAWRFESVDAAAENGKNTRTLLINAKNESVPLNLVVVSAVDRMGRESARISAGVVADLMRTSQ
jgi:hypothetical protein